MTIKGGDVEAWANPESETAPAIGGCKVVISGGAVKAVSQNQSGAAIGGGKNEMGDVTITGGTVKAFSTHGTGAAIGGGKNMGANVKITGGSVEAETTLSSSGAAIGGGEACGGGGNILITGGRVKASSDGAHIPAIGSGRNGWSAPITITGGNVTAESSACNAIGATPGHTSGAISITGGQVTARDCGYSYSGIASSGGLTLGWSSLNDRITGNFVSRDYRPGNVRFQQGKYFWLGNASTVAMPANLDGRTLIPSEVPNTCRVNFYMPLASEPWRTQYVPMGARASDPGDPFAGVAGYDFAG